MSGSGMSSIMDPQYALDRGNDWNLAENLDGIGCSSFPKWFGMDDASFGMRIEFVKSAARGKKIWLSEIQGGRSAIGFGTHTPVDGASQQRWLWTGVACGADKLLFWCWRDEVFGRESAGFGITGRDGFADDRIMKLKKTRAVLDANRKIFDNYKPTEDISVGILFSPQSYYMVWAQEATAARCSRALEAYARALVRASIPYRVIEEEHLDAINGLKIIFLPRVLVTTEKLEKHLTDFVNNGGTIVCESECGAFTPQGFYRYPEDRFIAQMTGAIEIGRRLPGQSVSLKIDRKKWKLPAFQWLTPLQGGEPVVLSSHKDGALIAEYSVGKGSVVQLGSYFAEAYMDTWNEAFEELIENCCHRVDVFPDVLCILQKKRKDNVVYIKTGESEGKKLLFIFCPEKCKKPKVLIRDGFLKGKSLMDLFNGRKLAPVKSTKGYTLTIPISDSGFSVLVELDD